MRQGIKNEEYGSESGKVIARKWASMPKICILAFFWNVF